MQPRKIPNLSLMCKENALWVFLLLIYLSCKNIMLLSAVLNPNFSRQQCHQQILLSLDKISFCSFNEIGLKDKRNSSTYINELRSCGI